MLTFVLGLALSIPLAILANLVTPSIRTALDKRSSSRRAQRIARIRKLQELLAEVGTQPSRAVGELGLMITRLLPLWAFVVVTSLASLMADLSTVKGIGGLTNVLGVIFPLSVVYTIIRTNGTLVMFRRLADPEWATRQAESQLRKLGTELEPHA